MDRIAPGSLPVGGKQLVAGDGNGCKDRAGECCMPVCFLKWNSLPGCRRRAVWCRSGRLVFLSVI